MCGIEFMWEKLLGVDILCKAGEQVHWSCEREFVRGSAASGRLCLCLVVGWARLPGEASCRPVYVRLWACVWGYMCALSERPQVSVCEAEEPVQGLCTGGHLGMWGCLEPTEIVP